MGDGKTINKEDVIELDEVQRLMADQFAPMFDASKQATAAQERAARSVVDALVDISKAMREHTAQMRITGEAVKVRLEDMGNRLTTLCDRLEILLR